MHGGFSLVFLSSQVPITVIREYVVGGVHRSSGKEGIPGDGDEGKLLTEARWWLLGFRGSRGIFCLWVSMLCRAEWNQGDIEESRVWLFSDRFDDNQDLGSEGRPAGC